MLIINQRDQIEFNIDLLQSETPTTMEETMQRYKDWDINLFYHVVSSPTCRYERRFGHDRIPAKIAKLTAEERFLNILRGKAILGVTDLPPFVVPIIIRVSQPPFPLQAL